MIKGLTKALEMPESLDGYIKISNKGEIDVNAFTLLGATTKREDEKMIGYFGSGLKYAIAVLLKNKIDFKVFSGEKEIKITTSKKDFRGTSFDVIKINNKLTSLTTDMGPDWKPWFAVREIYCNALDESEASIGLCDDIEGQKGFTNIYIKFDYQLSELFSNWNKYFSEKRTDVILDDNAGTTLFSGSKRETIVYRRGVQCFVSKDASLYHYNLDWVQINESRILTDSWTFKQDLAQKIALSATKAVVKNIYENYKGTYEADLTWAGVYQFSDAWLEVLGGRKIIIDNVAGWFMSEMAEDRDAYIVLPEDIAKSLKDYFGSRVEIMGMVKGDTKGIRLKTSKEQGEYCNFALEYLLKAGVKVDAPISIYEFEDTQQFGEARDGEILLSPKLFNEGKRDIVKCIYEEHCHIVSGHGDETRSFQNYLFNQIMVLMEEKIDVKL